MMRSSKETSPRGFATKQPAQQRGRMTRHMPNTALERIARAIAQMVCHESDLRANIESEEQLARNDMRCARVRCNSAAVRRPRTLPHIASVRSTLPADESDAATSTAVDRPRTAAASVWNMRRASANARRKPAAPAPYAAATDAAVSRRPGGVSAAATPTDDADVVASLNQRCVNVELASLVHAYRTLWYGAMEDLRTEVQLLRQGFDQTRRAWRVVCIQRNYRMHKCRAAYVGFVRQLALVQACGRGLFLRRAFPRYAQETRAVRLLCRVGLGMAARKQVARDNGPTVRRLHCNRAAVRIQAAFRCSVASKRFWLLRRSVRACRVIQRATRGFLERQAYRRKEKEFSMCWSSLEWAHNAVDVRLKETAFRNRMEIWEHTARLAMTSIAVQQSSAYARRAVALRRMDAPFAPASSVSVGLLVPSMVGRADDYWSPKLSSVFDAHMPPAIKGRPPSSAHTRIKGRAVSRLPPISTRGRDQLHRLLVEAEEAVARYHVFLDHHVFVNFVMERVMYFERQRATGYG